MHRWEQQGEGPDMGKSLAQSRRELAQSSLGAPKVTREFWWHEHRGQRVEEQRKDLEGQRRPPFHPPCHCICPSPQTSL